jgi:hypothetical protein
MECKLLAKRGLAPTNYPPHFRTLDADCQSEMGTNQKIILRSYRTMIWWKYV